MAHKTLIDSTAYTIKGGRNLVSGTWYTQKLGKTLIDGTAKTINFGVPLSTTTPGEILMLNENGSLVPFYIAKHDYESGLNGTGRTLLVRKDCYDTRVFATSNNAYVNNSLDSWLKNTYKKKLDADILTAIGSTKFYNTKGNGYNTVTTVTRAVFQLSLTEFGQSTGYANTEGSALPIADTLRIAYLNGAVTSQWTRSPGTNYAAAVCYVDKKGNAGCDTYGKSFGSRPAFTLPGEIGVSQNADGTYSVAG